MSTKRRAATAAAAAAPPHIRLGRPWYSRLQCCTCPSYITVILWALWAVLSWIFITISDVLRIPRFFYYKRFHVIVFALFLVYISRALYEILLYDATELQTNSSEEITRIITEPVTNYVDAAKKPFRLTAVLAFDYLKVLAVVWVICTVLPFMWMMFQMCCPCIGVSANFLLSPLFARVSELYSTAVAHQLGSEHTVLPRRSSRRRPHGRQERAAEKYEDIDQNEEEEDEDESDESDTEYNEEVEDIPRKKPKRLSRKPRAPPSGVARPLRFPSSSPQVLPTHGRRSARLARRPDSSELDDAIRMRNEEL